MSQEFEGDLAGSVFWGADMKGARFRDVDLTGARISHAWLVDVEIDALVEQLVVNGVDVTAYVNERDAWYPLRTMLRPTDAAGMRTAWAALEAEWTTTLVLANQLPEDALHESVGGEWSLVETLRHLVFAIDKWFTAPVLGEPFHPAGLPNIGSRDFPWPGLDQGLRPSATEVVAARADRAGRFRAHVDAVSVDELARPVEVLENGTHTVHDCIFTVLEEEFWHNRYARRDLELLHATVR